MLVMFWCLHAHLLHTDVTWLTCLMLSPLPDDVSSVRHCCMAGSSIHTAASSHQRTTLLLYSLHNLCLPCLFIAVTVGTFATSSAMKYMIVEVMGAMALKTF